MQSAAKGALLAISFLVASAAGASCNPDHFTASYPYFYVIDGPGATGTYESIIGHFWSPGAYATTGEQQCDDSHWLFHAPSSRWFIDGTIGAMGCDSGCLANELIVSLEDSGYFAVGRVTRTATSPEFDLARIGRDWTMVPVPLIHIIYSGTGDYAYVNFAIDDPAPGFYGLPGVSALGTITGFRLYAGDILVGRVPYHGGLTFGETAMPCWRSPIAILSAAVELDNGAVVLKSRSSQLVQDCDTYPPGVGAVPDGGPGGLFMRREPSGNLTLDWGNSCRPNDHSYDIYEGTIGDWTSHLPKSCLVPGNTATFSDPGFSAYYFVGPSRGSYGSGVGGYERPTGATLCSSKDYSFCSP